jgi:hypothetical protein
LNGIQEVEGSIPFVSTTFYPKTPSYQAFWDFFMPKMARWCGYS